MNLTINFISDLLVAAVNESDEATTKYADAQKHLSQAKAAKYEEFETPDGRIVMKPITASMAEIEAETTIPDDALPNGRSTKEERQSAARAWLLKNHSLYAAYQEQLDDADFRAQMSTATVYIVEQAAKSANAKLSAAAAFAAYLTAAMENETERLKIASMKSSMATCPECSHEFEPERGMQEENKLWRQLPDVIRKPQDVDDGVF